MRKFLSRLMVVALIMAIGILIVPTFVFASTPNWGHVRGRTYINSADVTLLRRYVASGEHGSLARQQFRQNNSLFNAANADVNGDEIINEADITLLRSYIAATDPSTVRLGPAQTGRRSFTRDDFPPGARFVALTYDDGPNRRTADGTIGVLNNLAEFGAFATFYVLGSKVEGNEDILQRMIAEGHDVDNHSWNHPSFDDNAGHGTGIGGSRANSLRQLVNTSNAIYNATGYWPWSFRAPYLEFGTRGHLNNMDVELSMAFICRNVETNDWQAHSTASGLATIARSSADGSIILFHDCGGLRRATVDAIPLFVPQMQAQGFYFVTVRQLYEINNVSPRRFVGQQVPGPNNRVFNGEAMGAWVADPQPLWPNFPQGPGRPANVPVVTPY
jgi:peptidoglycan/xylan/chitin deacetylase (PgdA/CDA1 family)